MKTSPVSAVKATFQSKEKLVEAVQKLATSDLWLDRVNSTKGLARVSNRKLLRLHALLTDAKSRFGSRDKLIAAIAEIAKREKDAGYKQRLAGYPLPRLVDLHGALSKKKAQGEAKAQPRAKKASAKAEAKPAKKAPAKKTPAKKAPAKKSAKKG